MGLIKLSFVFFFRRIFVTGKPKSRFAIISLMVITVVILWVAAFFLWFLLSCGNNFAARWTTIRTLHAVCVTDIKSDLALAISDFLTDVMIMALPVPMVILKYLYTRQENDIYKNTGAATSHERGSKSCRFSRLWTRRRVSNRILFDISPYNLSMSRALVASIVRLAIFVNVTQSKFQASVKGLRLTEL